MVLPLLSYRFGIMVLKCHALHHDKIIPLLESNAIGCTQYSGILMRSHLLLRRMLAQHGPTRLHQLSLGKLVTAEREKACGARSGTGCFQFQQRPTLQGGRGDRLRCDFGRLLPFSASHRLTELL